MVAAASALSGSLTLPASAVSTRRDLIELMRQICRDVCADRYMLVDLTIRAGEQARIVTSNWVYDAIDMVGLDLITRAARGEEASQRTTTLSVEEAALLAGQGHVDVVGLPVRAGRKRYALLLTAEKAGSLLSRTLAQVELLCSYALSLLSGKLGAEPEVDPLSERERECLYWVAEGKTTEEVGTILGVSGSTANNYLANAMQKLGARNRALAIATAIRQGLI
jgi:DNA-binding CsgD family transcriptional regulator